MTTDPFTEAARVEAWRRHPAPVDVETGEPVDDWGFEELGRKDFMAGAEWARAYLTERCTACGEDPSGPLRPLTTDERSYRYAQDLGYELPEEPR